MKVLTRVLQLLLLALICCATNGLAAAKLETIGRVPLGDVGALYATNSPDFPSDITAIDAWRSALTPVSQVNVSGGSYWFVVDFTNQVGHKAWVFEPYSTLINFVDARLYGADGSVQSLTTGYQRKLLYSLHYGQNIALEPNGQYRLVVRFSSPYFAAQPKFRLMPQAEYQQHVLWDNILTIGALGALLCLALYNLFVFTSTRDKSLLFYALYLIATATAWAWTFHLPTALFNIYELRWHYMWFFLMPITGTLFYLSFLQVATWSPLLTRLSWGSIALSVVLLPSSFFLLSHMHLLATICITVQLSLALICGVLSWRRGFKAARYFVVAFMFLLLPSLVILPANLGLIPELLENVELLALIGALFDGLLLAFALAERIRSLQAERDISLFRVTQALNLANTDSLTGIGNRHAFDLALQQVFQTSVQQSYLLMLIDLDGFKRINDQYGHNKGDDLLKQFAKALKNLPLPQVSSYRLGGDEFTLIAPKQLEAQLVSAIRGIEQHLREHGFAEFGASIGVAYGAEHQQMSEIFSQADQRMYEDKRKRQFLAT